MGAQPVLKACGMAFGPAEVALVRRLIAQAQPRTRAEIARRVCAALELEWVRGRERSALWNRLIERYHYRGYTPLPGAQLRYLVHGAPGVVAAIGFAAPAWKVAVRDRWIGWDARARERGLARVLNNARFLVLP